MKFRTELPQKKGNFQFNHTHSILSLGSCFAESMGGRLGSLKFNVKVNPFGIIYNPYSIAGHLERLCSAEIFTEEDLIEYGGIWHSFEHHSRFSNMDKKRCLEEINTPLVHTQKQLQKLDILIITLGTANVYIYQSTGKVAVNCHKVPMKFFEKRRLSVIEIVDRLTSAIRQLRLLSSDLKIIFTISPIRHIRDGIIENQRSKSTLILAVEQLTKQLKNVDYFPAFELIMDDLRDYRFFEKDLVHPNELAQDYIWNFFTKKYWDEEAHDLNHKIQKVIQATSHRPRFPKTETHQQFLKRNLLQIEELLKKYPFLNFKTEKNYFIKQLST